MPLVNVNSILFRVKIRVSVFLPIAQLTVILNFHLYIYQMLLSKATYITFKVYIVYQFITIIIYIFKKKNMRQCQSLWLEKKGKKKMCTEFCIFLSIKDQRLTKRNSQFCLWTFSLLAIKFLKQNSSSNLLNIFQSFNNTYLAKKKGHCTYLVFFSFQTDENMLCPYCWRLNKNSQSD